MSMLPNAERTLASVAGLALFTLNEVRMFHSLPRSPDPGNGQIHAVTLQLLGATEPAYLTTLDLALRWGLAGLTVSLCVWAIAETLKPLFEPSANR
jgi:hypothetical protein